MLVKSARRYVNTLDKILKSQHNDIITKTTEYNDYDISYIKLNFHIEGCYCFVSAHNNSDTITYYVTGCDDVIEYIISDNETQKDSMYTILNRLYDIVVRLTTEAEETEEAEEAEETEEVEEAEETVTRATIKIPYVDGDYSNFMKVPKNSIYGMFGNMSLPCRVCTHFCTRCDNDNYIMEYCCRKNKENEKKAIKNPEWHHVSLKTLTNLDFYMLDTKRQKYMTIYKLARNTIKSMYKCKSITQYRSLTNRLITYVHSAYRHDRCAIALVQYVRAKIADVNVNCNVQSSVEAEEYGYHESRRYN